MAEHCVVCVMSGGPDSAVAAALQQIEGFKQYFLTFNYGQNSARMEETCARNLASHFGAVDHKIVQLNFLSEIGGSGMTKEGFELSQKTQHLEYVPFRNTIFLSIAVAWAEVLGAERVVIGSIGAPWITPDNSPEYFDKFQAVVNIATKLKTDIRVLAPFCRSNKTDVIKRGLELDVPFEKTWSCQNSNDLACGICGNCKARLKAFNELNIKDPIKYSGKEEG